MCKAFTAPLNILNYYHKNVIMMRLIAALWQTVKSEKRILLDKEGFIFKIFYTGTLQLFFISSFNFLIIASNPLYQSRCGLHAAQPPA